MIDVQFEGLDDVLEMIKDLEISEQKQSADLYIEYMFYNKKKTDFCSNKNLAYTHYIQVDIFSKGDFTTLEKAIEKVMEEKGYNFITSADMYEDDTKLYHKALRYTFKEMVKK